MLGKKKV